jgi:hypothetical protein
MTNEVLKGETFMLARQDVPYKESKNMCYISFNIIFNVKRSIGLTFKKINNENKL